MAEYQKTAEAVSRLSPEQYRVTQQSATESPGPANTCTIRQRESMSTSSRASRCSPRPTSTNRAAAGRASPSRSSRPRERTARHSAWHGPDRGALGVTATAIWGMCFRTAARIVAGCATASTRRRCASCRARDGGRGLRGLSGPGGGRAMTTERAVLAGGCFWGMQDLIRRYAGVISTRVGYTGGDVPNATYRNHGNHAEAIEIIFDPAKTELSDDCWNSSSRSTIRRRGTGRATMWARAIARRSSTPARSRRESPRTPSPTWTRPACGQARW